MSVPCQRIEYQYHREPFPHSGPCGSGLPTLFPQLPEIAGDLRGSCVNLAKRTRFSIVFVVPYSG